MAYTIYVDESLNASAEFIVTAAVCVPRNIEQHISEALINAGMQPGVDEYKSSSRKAGDKVNQSLRSSLGWVIVEQGCGIALLVSHIRERDQLGLLMLELLEQMRLRGRFGDESPGVFFDRGILSSNIRSDFIESGNASHFLIHRDDDSRKVLGLQLADLAAHMAATILKCDLGLLSKMTPAGPGSGYDPDTLMELEFELWASFRYSLASNELAFPADDREPSPHQEHDAFGLYITEKCNTSVRDCAYQRFAHVYMGCIH